MRIGFNEEQLSQIMNTYPYAWEAFRRHYYKTKGLETMLGKISPEANADEVKRSMDMFVKLILSDNFRDLYEFFDDESIYASIAVTKGDESMEAMANILISDGDDPTGEKSTYYCSEMADGVDHLLEIPSKDEGVNVRVKAERYSFLKCFELLNERLTKEK